MNELFDKLTLRFIFALVILAGLFLYKHTHRILYPSFKSRMFQRFFPGRNPTDNFHLLSRILGIGIIFSEFHFNVGQGLFMASFDFFVRSMSAFVLYLGSLYIIEGIVLYNFEYKDEIIRAKNLSYALVCFAHAVGIALNIKAILHAASESLIVLFFLWLLTMVLLGLATKAYPLTSKLNLNGLLVQKNMAVAVSYTGFFLGLSLIIASGLDNPLNEIRWYTIQIILKILLSLIILPVIIYGLKFLFKLENKNENTQDMANVEVGYGLQEGTSFFTSCLLTTVLTGQIYFENLYPIF